MCDLFAAEGKIFHSVDWYLIKKKKEVIFVLYANFILQLYDEKSS